MVPIQRKIPHRYKSFFNKSWTRNQTIDAINYDYKQIVKNDIINGKYELTYLGEKITIVIEERNLKTAYGEYKYTYNEFMRICDEMKSDDFNASLYLRK